jgi:hypothetical protein
MSSAAISLVPRAMGWLAPRARGAAKPKRRFGRGNRWLAAIDGSRRLETWQRPINRELKSFDASSTGGEGSPASRRGEP